MRTGELIRTLRKEKKLTQEQMADLLGVSAPAVNKWENGNSMPDVMLLAPLARLLGTDVNTLLNFQEELSEKEIGRIANEISMKLRKENYEEAFAIGEEYLHNYPGCGQLYLNLGSIYNGAAVMAGEANKEWKETFTKKGQELLDYACKSKDRSVADPAAYYNVINAINQENFQKAELLLSQIPETYIKKEDIYPGFYMRQKKYAEAKTCLEKKMLNEGAGLLTSMDMYVLTCLKLGEQERAEKIAQLFHQIADLLKIPGLNPYSAPLNMVLEGSKKEKTKEDLQKQREEAWKLLEQFLEFYMNPENTKYENSILFQKMEQSEKQEAGEIKKSYGVLMERVVDAIEEKEDGAFLREDERFEERLKRLKQIIK